VEVTRRTVLSHVLVKTVRVVGLISFGVKRTRSESLVLSVRLERLECRLQNASTVCCFPKKGKSCHDHIHYNSILSIVYVKRQYPNVLLLDILYI